MRCHRKPETLQTGSISLGYSSELEGKTLVEDN